MVTLISTADPWHREDNVICKARDKDGKFQEESIPSWCTIGTWRAWTKATSIWTTTCWEVLFCNSKFVHHLQNSSIRRRVSENSAHSEREGRRPPKSTCRVKDGSQASRLLSILQEISLWLSPSPMPEELARHQLMEFVICGLKNKSLKSRVVSQWLLHSVVALPLLHPFLYVTQLLPALQRRRGRPKGAVNKRNKKCDCELYCVNPISPMPTPVHLYCELFSRDKYIAMRENIIITS